MKYLKCEKHNIFYPVSDEEFYLTTNPPCPICCPTIIRYRDWRASGGCKINFN